MSDFLMEKIFTRKNKDFLILTGVVFGVYIAMKFISPLVAPFLFSFLILACLYPKLEWIQKKFHIKKGITASVCILCICIFLAVFIGWTGNVLLHKCMEIIGKMDVIEEQLGTFLSVCCEKLEKRFGFNGTYIESFIMEQVNIQIDNLEINIMPKLMGGSLTYLKNLAGFLGFFIVMIISVLLLLKDYDKIIRTVTHDKRISGMIRVGRKVIAYIRTFLRAQMIILATISGLCAVTLWAIGIKGGIVLGILTGMLEVLPFIGTGIMLVPLALIQLLTESYWQAGACMILYGACALVREVLEPRLIGNKVGIWPVAILFAVYVGIQLFGLVGIVKGPIGLVIIFETYQYLKETREECPE